MARRLNARSRPFTLRDGSSRMAQEMLGCEVLTDTVCTEPVWSVVNKVKPTGELNDRCPEWPGG